MKGAYTLHYGKNPDLWPVMAWLHDEETTIFSVPSENAVGTNSINNAITLLKFRNDELHYEELKRDFVGGVGIGDKFYPRMFKGPWIGYTQTRGFLLFNCEERYGVRYMPPMTGDEYYTDVQTFDEEKFRFVFQRKEAYWPEGIRHLDLVEFNPDGTFRMLATMKAGKHEIRYLEPWAIQNKVLFLYNEENSTIQAFDSLFHTVSHPFCDLFNIQKDFQRLDQIEFHPNAPFAVLVEIEKHKRDKYRIFLAAWENPDPEKRFVELLRQDISMFSGWHDLDGLSCSHFEFSPDGRWLVFRDDSEALVQDVASPTFVAMPVDPKREMPLGKPEILGKVLREYARPNSTAWITTPLSFVVCDGQILYKWELDKLPREF